MMRQEHGVRGHGERPSVSSTRHIADDVIVAILRRLNIGVRERIYRKSELLT